MSVVRALGRFVYDFVVGDCWQLSLAVAVMLIVAGIAAATGAVPPVDILLALAVAVLIGGPLVVVLEGRRSG